MNDLQRTGMTPPVFAMGLAVAPNPASGRSASVGTSASLEVITNIPSGKGPFPAVVLAPGAGYDMHQPLMERLSEALVARNIAVIRFNWTYFTADPKQGRASPDLAREIGDMKAALSIARGNAKIDGQRIILAGKSLGSVVAFRLFRRAPRVRAAILLTPLCTLRRGAQAPAWMAVPYADFSAETRPVALILGDKDPLCRTQDLYSFAASSPGSVRVAIVGGDHSFANAGRIGSQDRNLDLAIANAVDAAETWLSASPDEVPAH